jgi:HEAT repeat protein
MIDKLHFREWASHLIKQLHIVISDMGIYPPQHPMISRSLKRTYQELRDYLGQEKELTIGVIGNRLVVRDSPLEERDKSLVKFITDLNSRKIQSITFLRGLKIEELQALLQALATKPDILEKKGGAAKALLKPGISHLRINEVRYEKLAKGERVLRLEEGVDLIIQYLLGKTPGVGEFKDTFVQEIKRDPKHVGEIITNVANAVDRTIEVRAEAVLRSIQRVGDDLLDGSVEAWQELKAGWAEVILSLEPELRATVLREKEKMKVDGTDDLLRDIIEEFSDQAILNIILNEYNRGEPLINLKSLAKRLLSYPERKERLEPLLKKRLLGTGMSQEDYSYLIGEEMWPGLSSEERARRLLEKEPRDLLDEALLKTIESVIKELITSGRDDLISPILKKFLKNLEDPASIIRQQTAEECLKFIEILFWGKKFEQVEEGTKVIIQNLEKEKVLTVYSALATNLEKIAKQLIFFKKYSSAMEIVKKFTQHAYPISGKSREEQERAQEAKIGIADPKTIEALLSDLKDKDQAQVKEISQLLVTMGKKTVNPLIRALREERDIKIRRRIISVIKGMGKKALEPLKLLLSDKRWYIVKDVVEILGDIGDESAASSLILPLNHDYFKVRMETVLALERIGGARAIELLTATLGDRNNLVRQVAVTSLGNMGAVNALPMLFKIIHRRRFSKRNIAFQKKVIGALAKIDPKKAKPEIISLLRKRPRLGRKRYDEIRICAALTLGKIKAREALPELERVVKNKNERLRRAAEEAIKEIKKS